MRSTDEDVPLGTRDQRAFRLVGAGMLAVPVLAGSCAYAIAEALAWRGSPNRRPSQARKFYLVLVVARAFGMALNCAGFNAIRLLFTTDVINGVLAPPLIFIVVLLTRDRALRGLPKVDWLFVYASAAFNLRQPRTLRA